MTDLRQELLAAFDAEHREHVDAIRAALARAGRGEAIELREVFRRAHSLKGAARAVDAPGVEDLSDGLESLFQALVDRDRPPSPAEVKAIEFALDGIERQVAAMTAGEPAARPEAALAALAAVAPGPAGAPAEKPAPAAAPVPAQPPAGPGPAPASPAVPALSADRAAAEPADAAARGGGATAPATEFLRVSAGHVDALHGAVAMLAGELATGGDLAGELRRMERDIAGLAATVDALEKQSPQATPAALARWTEAREGLKEHRRRLQRMTRAATGFRFALDRAAAQVGEAAAAVALVPADSVLGGFGRMMRDLARDAGLEIRYETAGLDLMVDRRLLQDLKDPVLHALRNAVGHGAEPPERRVAKGLPPEVTVSLTAAAHLGHLVVTVADDGRGPDFAGIAARAREAGLIAGPQGGRESRIGAERLLRLVFEPGFSTAGRIDRLSGRGMGLSIVAEAVRALRGRVRLARRRPRGTELRIEVPLNRTVQPVLVVEAGGHRFALPSRGVDRLARVAVGALDTSEGRPVYWIDREDGPLIAPVVNLATLVGAGGDATLPVEGGFVRLVLIVRGDSAVALAVDALEDARPMTVEPTVAFTGRSSLVAGAVLPDGVTPAAVLDPDGLMDRVMAAEAEGDRGLSARIAPVAEAVEERRTILVVDDSITTRTLEKSILEAQGYRVLLCVDGLDALNLLRSGTAVVDLVVADVEMPRMDGFALLQTIRNDSRFMTLPVVLMTSRAAPEDVRRGLDLGANAYVTKQKFDQRELLATIGDLL